MQRNPFRVLFTLPILLCAGVLYANAISMGGLGTVATDGALDSARNPALLAGRDSSLGFLLEYFPSIQTRNVFRERISGMNLSFIELKKEKTYKGNSVLGSIWRTGPLTLGIALGSPDTDLFSLRKYDLGFMGRDATLITTVAPSNVESRELNPNLALSCALKTTSLSSLGLRLDAAFNESFETKKLLTFSSGTNSFRTIKTGTVTAAFELVLGYLYDTGRTQFGAEIKSGKLSYRKQSLDYWFLYTMPGHFKGEHSYYRQYDRSPGLSMGVHHKLFSFLAFSLEEEFQSAGFFRVRDYAHPGGDTLNVQKFKTSVASAPQLTSKAGLEFSLIPWIIISAGANYTFTSQVQTTNGIKTMVRQRMGYASLGADFLVGESTRIITGVKIYRVSVRKYENESNPNVSTIKLKSFYTTPQVYFGMSFGL